MTNWTWADYDYLYHHYATDSVESIADALSRSVLNIEDKAEKLGLQKRADASVRDKQLVAQFGKQLKTAMIFVLPHLSVTEMEVLLDEYAPAKGKPRSKPPATVRMR